MKLSDLRTAAEIHEQDMCDPEYKREHDRAKLANDVAVQVLAYRAEHGMSQKELARRLGMRQPNIARLESGEHEPSLTTLARLSALGIGFSIEIRAGSLRLRKVTRPRVTPAKKVVAVKGGIAMVPSGRQATPSRLSLAPAAHHRRDLG